MILSSYENRLRKVAKALMMDSQNSIFIVAKPGQTAQQALEKALAGIPKEQQPYLSLCVSTWNPGLEQPETEQTEQPRENLKHQIEELEHELKTRFGVSEQTLKSIGGVEK